MTGSGAVIIPSGVEKRIRGEVNGPAVQAVIGSDLGLAPKWPTLSSPGREYAGEVIL